MSLTKAVCENCGTEEHFTTEYTYSQNKVQKNLYSIFIFVADEDFRYVNYTGLFVLEVVFSSRGPHHLVCRSDIES